MPNSTVISARLFQRQKVIMIGILTSLLIFLLILGVSYHDRIGELYPADPGNQLPDSSLAQDTIDKDTKSPDTQEAD